MSGESPGYQLAHPVYLDLPMMMSFLAHLEGGVSVSGSETTRSVGTTERLLKGRGGFRAKLWTIADAELGGERSSQTTDEASAESQTERHHTAASLFNVLYAYLREDQMVRDIASPDDLDGLRPGEMVEINAQYLGNPIEDILAFFNTIIPYLVPDDPAPEPKPGPNARKSGNPAKRAAAEAALAVSESGSESDGSNEGIKMLLQMAEDIADAPVHDLLFKTEEGLQAVVTVASEFYTSTTNEHLRSGQFRVVGKVTKVLRNNGSINLTRRTVLGAAGPDLAQTTIGAFTEIEDLSLDIAEPIISAPAVQILPMAIFI